MDRRGILIVSAFYLTLVVLLQISSGAAEESDETLSPDGPNVCSRTVSEYQFIITNVTRPCYRLEYSDPPCADDTWRYWGRSGGHRGRHGGRRGRWPRYASTTTYRPRTSTTDDLPSWYRTTTTGAVVEYFDDDDSSSEDFYDGRMQCCKKVIDTCWYVTIRCVLVDVPHYFCCSGYEPDGNGGCKLQIECAEQNGGCDQMCYRDEVTGHHCACFNGYNLANETHCQDVDECKVDNGGCNQKCVNLPGSHYCACESGYELTQPDTCTEIDECAVGNGGCDHRCVNSDGAFYCECEDGFDLVDGSMCIDVNECLDNNGGCSHVCMNDYEGFSCDCPEGYFLSDDGFFCVPEFAEDDVPPETLPVTFIGTLARPVVYISVAGGVLFLIVLIIVIAACCCRRRRGSANPAVRVVEVPVAVAAPAPVVVAKKVKDDLELGLPAELGDKAKMAMEDDDDDDYGPPPSVISYGSEPPPYAEKPEEPDGANGFDNPTYQVD